MHWLDLLLILVITGFSGVQMLRGFGKAALDALFLYAALWAADWAAPFVGDQFKMGGGAAVRHANADILLYVFFGLCAFGLSRLVYSHTQIDLGMFDKLLGLVAGIAAGMIAAHAIVRPMAMTDPTGAQGAATVAASSVGNEMLDFPTYHSLMDTLTGADTYRRSLATGVPEK